MGITLTGEKMKIFINGQTHELDGHKTLGQIIGQFCKDTPHVIAELNGKIIKTAQWPGTKIDDGDTVELVNIVGGG